MFRAKTRPKNPKTLDFSFEDDGIPDGLNLHDVVTAKRRHIVCFTNKQARLLKNAKRWYMDGTFSIIKKPFMQMWTIHAFIRYGNEKKMVPLCFVLMSSRTQKDYIRVLKHIKTVILGNRYNYKFFMTMNVVITRHYLFVQLRHERMCR